MSKNVINNLVRYYYLEKKMTIKDISKKVKKSPYFIKKLLLSMGINIKRDIELSDKVKLAFHLYHRVRLSVKDSCNFVNISVNTLKTYCKNKNILIRSNSYDKLSKNQKARFDNLWEDYFIYKQKNDFKVPINLKNVISSKMGDYILDYYAKDISPVKMHINNLIPTSIATIKNFLKANNIVIKQGEYYTTKYNVDKNYFEVIDTEQKAYWLGFILGDGCISGVTNKQMILRIALKQDDIAHLEKFQKSIKTNSPIKKYVVNKKYKVCSLEINNTFLAKSLSKYGIIKNKTYTATFPKIPHELKRHCIRGIFDADGCIPKSNGRVAGISICGTFELMSDIADLLDIDKKYIYIRKDLVNFAEIRCHKKQEALRILECIYRDANIYMDRKHQRFLQFKGIYDGINKESNKGVTTIETTSI